MPHQGKPGHNRRVSFHEAPVSRPPPQYRHPGYPPPPRMRIPPSPHRDYPYYEHAPGYEHHHEGPPPPRYREEPPPGYYEAPPRDERPYLPPMHPPPEDPRMAPPPDQEYPRGPRIHYRPSSEYPPSPKRVRYAAPPEQQQPQHQQPPQKKPGALSVLAEVAMGGDQNKQQQQQQQQQPQEVEYMSPVRRHPPSPHSPRTPPVMWTPTRSYGPPPPAHRGEWREGPFPPPRRQYHPQQQQQQQPPWTSPHYAEGPPDSPPAIVERVSFDEGYSYEDYPPPPPRYPHYESPYPPPPPEYDYRYAEPHQFVSPASSHDMEHPDDVYHQSATPYTYVQQPRLKEKTVLRKKFSWKHYPELERFLIANRDEYLRHSALNYTAEQKQYNNWLTERLLEVAARHHYVFSQDDFNFVGIRDRIRCYYKSYVQTARKRGQMQSLKKKEAAKKQEESAVKKEEEESDDNEAEKDEGEKDTAVKEERDEGGQENAKEEEEEKDQATSETVKPEPAEEESTPGKEEPAV